MLNKIQIANAALACVLILGLGGCGDQGQKTTRGNTTDMTQSTSSHAAKGPATSDTTSNALRNSRPSGPENRDPSGKPGRQVDDTRNQDSSNWSHQRR